MVICVLSSLTIISLRIRGLVALLITYFEFVAVTLFDYSVYSEMFARV